MQPQSNTRTERLKWRLNHNILRLAELRATIRAGHAIRMDSHIRTDLFHGLFRWHSVAGEPAHISRHEQAPRTVPDPQSGRLLKVASLEIAERAMCPACAHLGRGGFVSFVSDLRMAYACPSCRQLVWVQGA